MLIGSRKSIGSGCETKIGMNTVKATSMTKNSPFLLCAISTRGEMMKWERMCKLLLVTSEIRRKFTHCMQRLLLELLCLKFQKKELFMAFGSYSWRMYWTSHRIDTDRLLSAVCTSKECSVWQTKNSCDGGFWFINLTRVKSNILLYKRNKNYLSIELIVQLYLSLLVKSSPFIQWFPKCN